MSVLVKNTDTLVFEDVFHIHGLPNDKPKNGIEKFFNSLNGDYHPYIRDRFNVLNTPNTDIDWVKIKTEEETIKSYMDFYLRFQMTNAFDFFDKRCSALLDQYKNILIVFGVNTGGFSSAVISFLRVKANLDRIAILCPSCLAKSPLLLECMKRGVKVILFDEEKPYALAESVVALSSEYDCILTQYLERFVRKNIFFGSTSFAMRMSRFKRFAKKNNLSEIVIDNIFCDSVNIRQATRLANIFDNDEDFEEFMADLNKICKFLKIKERSLDMKKTVWLLQLLFFTDVIKEPLQNRLVEYSIENDGVDTSDVNIVEFFDDLDMFRLALYENLVEIGTFNDVIEEYIKSIIPDFSSDDEIAFRTENNIREKFNNTKNNEIYIVHGDNAVFHMDRSTYEDCFKNEKIILNGKKA